MSEALEESNLQVMFAEQTVKEMEELVGYWKEDGNGRQMPSNALNDGVDFEIEVELVGKPKRVDDSTSNTSLTSMTTECKNALDESLDDTLRLEEMHESLVRQSAVVDDICKGDAFKANLKEKSCLRSPLVSGIMRVGRLCIATLRLLVVSLQEELLRLCGEAVPVEWLPLWLWLAKHPMIFNAVVLFIVMGFVCAWHYRPDAFLRVEDDSWNWDLDRFELEESEWKL